MQKPVLFQLFSGSKTRQVAILLAAALGETGVHREQTPRRLTQQTIPHPSIGIFLERYDFVHEAFAAPE